MKKILGAILLLSSCMPHSPSSQADGEGGAYTPVPFKYAKLLKVERNDSMIIADIRNPWSADTTAVLHHYEVSRPFGKVLVYTSVHCGLLKELGAIGSISGVGDAEYIHIPEIKKGLKDGTVQDCGGSAEPNIEAIINLSPDAIMLSPFENAGSYGKLGKLGIPIVECADYMENVPLGRAEWVRFYGMLMGREKEADSLFAQVEKEYLRLKSLQKSDTLPTVVTEMKIGNIWYVAAGDSYVGNMIKDAGGRYIFSDVAGAGALPYSPETVFDRSQQADIWVFKYSQQTDITLDELAKEWPNNKRMKAWQTGNAFGCNLMRNGFYEETPFHPEVLLQDFIAIMHPDIINRESLRYYKRLNNNKNVSQ